MRVTGQFEKQDQIQMSVTLTGTIGEFKKLVELIDGSQWPGWDVNQQIHEVVRKVTAIVRVATPEEQS